MEEKLLAAIRNAPGDDGAKLIYADWLDEQGDPRGQAIRLSVELRKVQRGMDTEWLAQMDIQVERENLDEYVLGLNLSGHLTRAEFVDRSLVQPLYDDAEILRAQVQIMFEVSACDYDKLGDLALSLECRAVARSFQ